MDGWGGIEVGRGGFSRLATVVACAVLALSIAGPFGTQASLAGPSRFLFWSAIVGLNAAKWQIWRGVVLARAESPAGKIAIFIAGALALTALLPLEIGWALEAVGKPARIDYLQTFAAGVALTLVIGMLRLALAPRRETAFAPVSQAEPEASPAVPPLRGAGAPSALFERGGIVDPADLLAVRSEDHYLRLHLANGRRPLILYRFGDALRELSELDGEQVHRGTWVAGHAVAGAERNGRRWRLRLVDGSDVPVSESFIGAARRRGWLRAAASN